MWLQILSIIQINHFKHHLINILVMKIKKWVSMFFNQGLIFLSNYEARDTKNTIFSSYSYSVTFFLFSLCVCLLERTCSLHNTNIKQWLTGTLIHIPTYILVINKNTIQFKRSNILLFSFYCATCITTSNQKASNLSSSHKTHAATRCIWEKQKSKSSLNL